jgi:8-oxo-dGTP pyrophosphatase MutT (NUDIX family)
VRPAEDAKGQPASFDWAWIETALRQRPAARVAREDLPRAAVALLLREGDAGLELLFIRRSESPQDPWSGHIGFPGGRAEPADGDLLATARRETFEEIGADLARDATHLGTLDDVHAMARLRPVDLGITPHVFRLRAPLVPRLSAEVRSVHWFPLAALFDGARRSSLAYPHQGALLQFPCVRMNDDVVIWGLTYRMLEGLRERLAQVAPVSTVEA